MSDFTVSYTEAPAAEVRYSSGPAGRDADRRLYVVEVAGATYTLSNADHGRYLHFTGECTVTVPTGLMEGFSCCLVQDGVNPVTVAAGAGATVNHPDDHTQTRTQYSPLTLWRRSATVYFIGGDTA